MYATLFISFASNQRIGKQKFTVEKQGLDSVNSWPLKIDLVYTDYMETVQ